MRYFVLMVSLFIFSLSVNANVTETKQDVKDLEPKSDILACSMRKMGGSIVIRGGDACSCFMICKNS